MQTITHPDQILTHKSDKYKRVKKKKFPNQTGIHGCNSKPCYGVVVVEKTTDNRLITAYPVLTWHGSAGAWMSAVIAINIPA